MFAAPDVSQALGAPMGSSLDVSFLKLVCKLDSSVKLGAPQGI